MADKMYDGAKNAADNVADKAKSAVDTVANKADGAKDAAKGLVEKVQERAKSVTDSVVNTAEKATEKTGEWIGDAAGTVENAVSDGYRSAEHEIEQFGKDVTNIVRKYPLTAVAIGLGLGMLLGRATNSRA